MTATLPSTAKSLSWRIDADGHAAKVALSGDINESAQFDALPREFPAQVILDLAEIRRINSIGVRQWIEFVNSLTGAGKSVVLERCSVAIVSQLNMISNFAAGAEVRTAFAPYFCDHCGEDRLRLVDVKTTSEDSLENGFKCPECGNAARFDDLPDSYLSFAKS